jgi:heterodisulfide reductase subunit A-like polyferredoxin
VSETVKSTDFPTQDKPHDPVGSVLVVGGGIAGMQASLDLANQGFQVHLVEKNSAIGGHMAQLDKTFPTNDCAMCTISPKLVDTGRHLNIDLKVDTEVVRIDGEAGDFSVTLRNKPRYIDLAKCVGCGDCVDVCPVVLPDLFNEGLNQKRAAFKLYPQAVPNAYAIEKIGIAPCRDACPAGQRAHGYIAMINQGRYEEAYRVIKEDNPFPGICGRICNHLCEIACNRANVDEPINIRALKRFVSDFVYEKPRTPVEPARRVYDQNIAIIGAGPCGLTAAQDLVLQGYGVTVLESLPVAGGMLRVGVPEYRLPSEIIEREIADIVDLGIDLRLNTRVDDLDQLFDDGFDAVLISVGAHEGVRLPIPGADLNGVLINTLFLRDVRLGDLPQIGKLPEGGKLPEVGKLPELGKRVLVLGGGNVAMDCARTAVRLGSEVHMACLEPRDGLPCHDYESDAAEEEGVTIHPDRTFLRILDDGQGNATGVECAKVQSFSFDQDGRLSFEVEPGSEHILEADTIIFSVGQRAGLAFIPEDAGINITPQRTISIDPHSMAASRPGVFAAGDSVTGTAFVIEAVASGRKAAESVHRFLRGDQLDPPAEPNKPVIEFTKADLDARVERGEFSLSQRIPLPELPVNERVGGFQEIEGNYSEDLARAEAARCLDCGMCSECLACVYACGPNAIDHNMVESIETVKTGAVILAPGFQVYQAELSQEYGLGRYPNVVTSLQFERLLSASGPTGGHVHRPSDNVPAKRIAFLQCVGSRDQSHDYCSAVCCMYATKEAVMAKEHMPDAEVHIFMMDMRAFSKGYLSYYQRAQDNYGIEYTRCRVSELKEDPATGNLLLRYKKDMGSTGSTEEEISLFDPQSPISGLQSSTNSNGNSPFLQVVEESFDMVVLSVGMEISESVRNLGRDLGVELDEYGFCHTTLFNPLETSRPGIYVAGPFREPKDIPETIVEASGAAAQSAALLATSRHTLTKTIEFPPERDVENEPAKTGVFVCHCGSNIGGYLDVPMVVEHAKELPGVVHAEHNLYTCSQDSVVHISEKVDELGLNRVVIASCTPHTHGPLFQDCIRAGGLNPALFEMANIRNHCSWVHSHDRINATTKAKDLVRMAVGRAATLRPLSTSEVEIEHAGLVIGGGVAGMTAALNLARGGFDVNLVERENALGGNLRNIFRTASGDDPQAFLRDLIREVESEPRIKPFLGYQVTKTLGTMGNFVTTLLNGSGESIDIRHAITIMATGGQEYRGGEYGYGDNPRVLTGLEFEALLAEAEGLESQMGDRVAEIRASLQSDLPDEIVMVYCVGPADEYCSRICCTTGLKNALALKQLKPDAQITILFRDIRTYGFKEDIYTQARQAGIRFVRYEDGQLPNVSSDPLRVNVLDLELGLPLEINPDLVVLSMPIIPSEGSAELASSCKTAVDADGFFMEAHVKLRPVDFATEGMFMAGAAHYPKLLDESIAQASAAAARASIILSQPTLIAGGAIAQVNASLCVGCLTCVRVCPFDVPVIDEAVKGSGGIFGTAFIDPIICQGCGNCVSECPAKAIDLLHYEDEQIIVKLDSLLLGA